MPSREYVEQKIADLNKEIVTYSRANSRNPHQYARLYIENRKRILKAYESILPNTRTTTFGTKWTNRGVATWER